MDLIVEEISRAKKVLQRQKFTRLNRITIGRALDNDVVLNDPHVSPHHAELRKDEDNEWHIFDCQSINGLKNNKRKAVTSGTTVSSGDSFVLGRSRIAIWDQLHPVEEAWPLHAIDRVFEALSQWQMCLVLFVLYVLSQWQLIHIQTYREIELSTFTNGLFSELFFVLGWAFSWSLAGRILRHDSRIYGHLSVALIAAMAFEWIPHLLQLVAFNLSLGTWLTEIRYFINGALFSLILWSNFYLAVPQRPLARVVWANSLAWGLVLLFLIPPLFDRQDYIPYPVYDSTILPASSVWRDASEQSQFLEKTDGLYQSARVSEEASELSTADDKRQSIEASTDK